MACALRRRGASRAVVNGIDRSPVRPRTMTFASSAANATATSEGWMATQASDHPKMARLRLKPWSAPCVVGRSARTSGVSLGAAPPTVTVAVSARSCSVVFVHRSPPGHEGSRITPSDPSGSSSSRTPTVSHAPVHESREFPVCSPEETSTGISLGGRSAAVGSPPSGRTAGFEPRPRSNVFAGSPLQHYRSGRRS